MHKNKNSGITLIELMIAMAIGLVIVAAATVIYLQTIKNQRALERKFGGLESGRFVLQLIGRDILNAGFYPSHVSPDISDVTQVGMYDTYPPLEASPRKSTDWGNASDSWPPTAYETGVYGCEGAQFDVRTATCPAPEVGKSDSLVVNYFASDVVGGNMGRRDCTGSLVDNDISNAQRKNTADVSNSSPKFPLFVSNRYVMSNLKNLVDQQDENTGSLACSGNGSNPFNSASVYQPIMAGIKDLQFSYGVYQDDKNILPNRFYSASEVTALPSVEVFNQTYSGWQRVIAVKVCVLSHSQGGGVRLADEEDKQAQYQDCDGALKNHPSGQWVHNFSQIFGVRNALKQSY